MGLSEKWLFKREYSDGHPVRTMEFFQNFTGPQLEPKKIAQLEPWVCKGF